MHFMEVYECGHVGAQCRCPGPKVERKIPGFCPKCVDKLDLLLEKQRESNEGNTVV